MRPFAAEVAYLSLPFLQNRAHDFAGITASDHGRFKTIHGKGSVREAIPEKALASCKGDSSIGHVRYPTALDKKSAQPLVAPWGTKDIALAHNGNLTNTPTIKVEYLPDVDLQTRMDSECLLHLIISRADEMPDSIPERCEIIDWALGQMRGSASLAILMPDCMMVVRDKSANRPIVIGQHPEGGVVAASEEPALFVHGIYEAEVVPPGTIECFSDEGRYTHQLKHGNAPEQFCTFEYMYLANITGFVNGKDPVEMRIAAGKQSATEHPVPNADLIMPVPNSGIPAAMGFAAANPSGKYCDLGLIKAPDASRTFIDPTQDERELSVFFKFLCNPRMVRDKVIVVVDDSLIRGTTTRQLVRMLFAMGAKEVHVRIAWFIWQYLCEYGLATRALDELAIHVHRSVPGIQKFIDATSLGFLSQAGLRSVISLFGDPEKHCFSCGDGIYRF